MDFTELTRPPYRDEPSIDDDERARRLACRVFLLGRSQSVPTEFMPVFRRVAKAVGDDIDRLNVGEQRELRRMARQSARAARQAQPKIGGKLPASPAGNDKCK